VIHYTHLRFTYLLGYMRWSLCPCLPASWSAGAANYGGSVAIRSTDSAAFCRRQAGQSSAAII